jgi:AcrR family transcriptional regulator
MKLLESKRFEEITIHELCENAMVRRATFYKHFTDKYDFFQFFISDLKSKFEKDSILYRQEGRLLEYYLSVTRKLIYFLDEHEKMVQHILESNMLATLFNILTAQIMTAVKEKLNEYTASGNTLPASPEILASFFTGGLLNTLQHWQINKNTISEEQLIQELENVVNAFYVSLTENSTQPPPPSLS